MGQKFPLKGAGGVNCYLVESAIGYILIDTGFHPKRTELLKELDRAGCKPGNPRLIIITHGDLDHTGNCTYLREKYGAKIAIHRSESEAVERADMASRSGWSSSYADDPNWLIFGATRPGSFTVFWAEPEALRASPQDGLARWLVGTLKTSWR